MESPEEKGIVLVANLWQGINCLRRVVQKLNNRDIIEARNLMVLAVHRLTFLEMVVKGLTYREQHDAAAYARFVEKKRNLEDMDIDEFREILRER